MDNHTYPARRVVIIGAGPAGLTAAYELISRSGIKPIILEALDQVGGISRTVVYKGNRMDIGGHRFFSKSDWVMNWWRQLLPTGPEISPEGISVVPSEDAVMLVRSRLSRIYFLRRFFDYPVSLSRTTIKNLGIGRLLRIGCSYIRACIMPSRSEKNLEDFLVNRFGRELYLTFFKSYTEKVWGVPCREISAAWGAQRIKGLSIRRALYHALKKIMGRGSKGLKQEDVNASLIERFLYPKLGPGQLWQVVAEKIEQAGGEVRYGVLVTGLHHSDGKITEVCCSDHTGQEVRIPCDDVISTMPLRDLIRGLNPPAPRVAREVAEGLCYRDFITVGLLVHKLNSRPESIADHRGNLLPDNWIYIQEPEVKLCRLQIFNNWSPALVKDADTIWLGLEYLCQENDDLWMLTDDQMVRFASAELAQIGLIKVDEVLDGHVERVPKAYPAYFGSYDRFDELRRFTDGIPNLFLIGRNGMHRYNNQDHSMLTAKLAVDAILSGSTDKNAIWAVNIDDEYHEEQKPVRSS